MARAAPKRRKFPFYASAFLIVGSLVVGIVSFQALVSQTSFRMRELSQHATELQQEHDRLELEIAELSAPGRVQKAARGLGMVAQKPADVRTISVRPEGEGKQYDLSQEVRSFSIDSLLAEPHR
jgi:cell division protein FtsL